MASHSISGLHRISGSRVLIVEDDEDSAELFACWLRDAGMHASIVSDAERALALAPVLDPAVVVIDLGLPTTDGIQLVDELRSIPELSCQYVAFTAYTDVRLPMLCQAAGFSAFFEKPVRRAAFIRTIYTMARSEHRAHSH